METSIDETMAFEADHRWIHENYAVLLSAYADHWIAVKAGRVIASSPDLVELLTRVQDLATTCVEYINPQSTDVVL